MSPQSLVMRPSCADAQHKLLGRASRPAGGMCLGLPGTATSERRSRTQRAGRRAVHVCAVTSGGDNKKTAPTTPEEVDEVTKKYGLEAGLWKALRSGGDSPKPGAVAEEASSSGQAEAAGKSNTELAKELLAKYGGAYLATSITLAIISFSFFYVLVDRGVDVPGLLQQVGIEVGSTGEKVGTVALAYAAHKAASPIRFPPTVLLTPIVANFLSKKGEEDEKMEK